MAKKNEVEKLSNNFVALSPETDFAVLVDQNLGDGGSAGVFDLESIPVPPAAGTHFMVPGLEGVTPQESVEGIIIWQSDFRAYWEKEFGQSEQNDPDCSSRDAKTGHGNPGGSCATCPLSQYGSKGKGQACTMKKRVLLLREGAILPAMVELPPSSLGLHKKFMLSLINAQLSFSQVVVKLTLSQKPNPVPHSVVNWTVVRQLSEDESASMVGYADKIVSSLNLNGGNDSEGSRT